MHAEKDKQRAVNEAGLRWAENVIRQRVSAGDLADNPLDRLRDLFKRNYPKTEVEIERSRDLLASMDIPKDAIDFSRADMPLTGSGLLWVKQWRSRVDVP